MSRPSRVRALLPLAFVAIAGCQDYNFNPVGQCLLQPGTERFTLSDISTADVLFVIDDSGSMAAEQAKLAANFERFITNLDQTNVARAAGGLQPIDFHIAVTSTSVFFNPQDGVCSNTCAGAAGRLVCCSGGNPLRRPQACTSDAACTQFGTDYACRTTCVGLKGAQYCCDSTGAAASVQTEFACTEAGAPCGQVLTHYNFAGCGGASAPPGAVGVAADQFPYPGGDFVSFGANPRVLHFDKELYGPAGANRQGFTRQQLIDWFAGSAGATGNAVVGTCGSAQEQGLQAARLAVEKALAGQQRDTVTAAGAVTWDPTSRVASSSAQWPHPGAKLVLVFIGDEDDCSSPAHPWDGLVWLPQQAGQDTCVSDTALPENQQKQFRVNEMVDFFFGLNRPIAAAFIASAQQTICGRNGSSSCSPGIFPSCTPGICLQEDCPTAGQCSSTLGPSWCGGQAPGDRLFAAAEQMRARGAEVVTGSVCDPDFGVLLDQIAEIVKPPSTLQLPTEPAEAGITFVRVAARDGQTRRTCKGPAPFGMTAAEANTAGYDWWFTATDSFGDPAVLSQFVYINHDTGNCEADPGETYSADYIALNPAGGCPSADETGHAFCRTALGDQTPWQCYVPPGTGRGTCICGAP